MERVVARRSLSSINSDSVSSSSRYCGGRPLAESAPSTTESILPRLNWLKEIQRAIVLNVYSQFNTYTTLINISIKVIIGVRDTIRQQLHMITGRDCFLISAGNCPISRARRRNLQLALGPESNIHGRSITISCRFMTVMVADQVRSGRSWTMVRWVRATMQRRLALETCWAPMVQVCLQQLHSKGQGELARRGSGGHDCWLILCMPGTTKIYIVD